MRFEAPRGTHDVLPFEQALWQKAVTTAEDVCRLYGFGRIQTPVFEDTGLFQRTSGAGSDIVQKEMYTFDDRAGRSLTLRPEGTAPNARAYVEHGLHRQPQPVKTFMVAPMYRYATPQRGRYREHWQLSVEAVGSADAALDAEVIHLYHELLRRLGITEWELLLNSIGDARCRPAYVERLNAWLDANADVLDDDARQKRATTPLRVFDVKNERVLEALTDAPTIGESLCADCEAHFEQVRRYLDAYDVPYTISPTLVRGLDYYTRTTFQYEGPEEGAQSTLCGGGRYDGLVEQVGGPPTPGIGFGAGIERLLLALADAGVTAERPGVDVFVVAEPDSRADAARAAAALRAAGVAVELDYAGRSQNAQVKHAIRLDARLILIVPASLVGVVRQRGRQDWNVRVDSDDFVTSIRAALA